MWPNVTMIEQALIDRLFKHAVSTTQVTECRMRWDIIQWKIEGSDKYGIAAYFEILPRHSPGAEDNNDKPPSG
jgi:hypothetical protein